MKIGDFFVQLGINADTIKLKEFVSSIGDIPAAAVGAIGALAGISLELRGMIESTLENAVGLKKFSDQTGISTDYLQKWQLAAQHANIDSQAVGASITGVNNNLIQLKTNMGGNYIPFARLGLNALKTSVPEVFEALRKAVHTMPRGIFEQTLDMLGISRDMTSVFLESKADFNKFSQGAGKMDPSQFKEALRLKEDIQSIRLEWQALSYEITRLVSGPLHVFYVAIESIIMALRYNSEHLRMFFRATGQFASAGMNGAPAFANGILDFVKRGMAPQGFSPNAQFAGYTNNHFDVDINNFGHDPQLTSQLNLKEFEALRNRHASVKFVGGGY